MKIRLLSSGSTFPCFFAAVGWLALAGAVSAYEVSVNYNLPVNEQNVATLTGAFTSPITETESAYPHVYGTIPCTQYMTFAPATHAASATGIAFTYNNPGTVSFDDVTVSYGGSLFGADVTTDSLKATIYTPTGTIGPVQPNGYFDNTYHNVELNAGAAHVKGKGLLSSLAYDLDFAADPASNPGSGTAGPISISGPSNPHNISSGATGYHVTYDYTTQLTTPVNILYDVNEDLGSGVILIGTITATGTFVTDPFSFSHTFDYYAGDANLDGTVNLLDLAAVGENWHATGEQWAQGDFDGNGTVNLLDLALLGENWHASMSSTSTDGMTFAEAMALVNFSGSANVPEPGALAMILGLAVSLAGYGWMRRRR